MPADDENIIAEELPQEAVFVCLSWSCFTIKFNLVRASRFEALALTRQIFVIFFRFAKADLFLHLNRVTPPRPRLPELFFCASIPAGRGKIITRFILNYVPMRETLAAAKKRKAENFISGGKKD
jgi:hypothetical protein